MIQSNGCNYCEVPAGHGYHFLKSWSITEAQITKVWIGGVGWPGESGLVVHKVPKKDWRVSDISSGKLLYISKT